MSLTPTDEQDAILDMFDFGANLVVEAGAGSGKTSTLKMIGRSTKERGLYLAYNSSLRKDARQSFPRTVTSHTSHSLATGPVARVQYPNKEIGGPRQQGRDVAEILGIREPLRYADDRAPWAPQQVARQVITTVERFCYSADDEIALHHVGHIAGVGGEAWTELAKAILPWARKAWADITDQAGRLRWEHDYYLKIYQLSRPVLRYSYLLIDEAQDLNPAVRALVESQTHAQIVLVGDRNQQLFGWRGAVDAMQAFAGTRLRLTQSFRFGHAIAGEANKWLQLLGSDMRVRGLPSIQSKVGYVAAPEAVLCRTNGTAIARVMRGLDAGRSVALVGGGGPIARMARAAIDLQDNRPCDHPELIGFASWREVQEYVMTDAGGSDLRVFVELVDRHTAAKILRVADQLVEPAQADLTVATVHKVKGLEWATVAIADDFREPDDEPSGLPGPVPAEDAMLAYVAVTRAKDELDREGVAWVDRHLMWQQVHGPAVATYAAEREQEYASRITTRLIEASSLGTADAVALREQARADLTPELTGMPEEQAEWEADEPEPKGDPEPPAATAAADHQPGDTVLYAGAPCEVVAFERSNVIPGWLYRVEDAAGLRSWVHGLKLAPLVTPDPEPEPASAPPVRRCDCGLGEPDAPCGCGSLGVPETEPEPVLEYAGYIVGDGDHDPSGRLLSPDCYQCRQPYQDCTCRVMADRRPVEEVARAAAA